MEYAYSSDTLILNNQRPVHWTLARLRNLLKECNNQVGSRKGLPLLSLTKKGVILRDIDSGKGKFPKDFESYKIVEPGHLIFCLFDIDETPRTVGLSNLNGMITGAYDVFNISEMVNKHFIYYYFLAIDDQKALRPYYSGLRKVVQLPKFLGIQIPIPPLDEQKKIVEYLSTKTSQIDVQQRERERELSLLDELKQAEIANVVTRGLNPDVPMKDSGIPWIGQIPAHWETKRLGSLFHDRVNVNSDYKFDRAYKFNYGTLVPKEETGDVADLRDTYIKYSVLQPNDIVINGLNLNYDFVSKRVAISPTDCIITSAYLVLRPFSNTFAEYFLQLFKAMDSQKLFHGMGTGIRLTLSFNELKAQVLPIPPLAEQKAIVEYIQQKNSAIDEMIANLRAEIDFLTEYKQRLIADVVTGQINVQNL